MVVEIDAEAEADVREIYEWYSAQSRSAANEVMFEFDTALVQIGDFPKSSTKVSRRARRHRLKRYPYGIYYEIRQDMIVIFAVTHLQRQPKIWRNRLK